MIPRQTITQPAKVTRHTAIPLGFTAAFQSQGSSLHHSAVKCSSTHACQALGSPIVTVRPCKRHTVFLSIGANKKTIMDLQNLISLNRFLLTATAAAWQHKRGASLTGMLGLGVWRSRESFSKDKEEWREVTVALCLLRAKRRKRSSNYFTVLTVGVMASNSRLIIHT